MAKQNFKFFRVLAVLISLLVPHRTLAAERVILRYGAFQRSISVRSLENFIEGDRPDSELKPYLDVILGNPQQIQRFSRTSFQFDPIKFSQLSYSYAGENVLTAAGRILKSPASQNGFYSLRSTLIQCTLHPDGFSLKNILNFFPTDLEIDLKAAFTALSELRTLQDTTQDFIQAIPKPSRDIDISQFPDLRKPGEFNVVQETREFYDVGRDRTLVFDWYFPEISPETTTETPVPLIVVSNGLGAKRNRFQHLAQHLTSHGYSVAILDHPGSSHQRQQAFYDGVYSENFDATEYIDRPLDISFLLDRLETLSNPPVTLDLQNVGVFGYSIGGTTALSLAGGKLDLENLPQNCNYQDTPLNLSILYQCRALELENRPVSDLEDSRIKAVYLLFPNGNRLFGETGLQSVKSPVFMHVTNRDLITPLLLEQYPMFQKIPISEKYFVIAENLPHTYLTARFFSQTVDSELDVDRLVAISKTYINFLSLAFFDRYLQNNELKTENSPNTYLNPAYLRSISEPPHFLHLTRQ